MAQLPDGTLLGGIGFDTQDIIGAGGWVTRIDAADDGTMVCGSDACGPRIRKPNARKWSKLYRPGVNGPMVDTNQVSHTTYDVAVCPTNSDVAYWIIAGRLCKTVNAGGAYTVTALNSIPIANPNEGIRMTGKPIAVDPVNANVVFVGTPVDGVKFSVDGGASFTTISSAVIPHSPCFLVYNTGTAAINVGDTITGATSGATATVLVAGAATAAGTLIVEPISGEWAWFENIQVGGVTKAITAAECFYSQARYIIAFDRTSAVVGGKTQGIYIFVTRQTGSGLYHSTDGGATWSNVAGGPSSVAHMRVSPHDGSVHLAGTGLSGGYVVQYRRWNGTTWIAPTDIAGKALAISPHNAGHIYMAGDGGALTVSTNNGVDWQNYAGPLRQAIDIPWHEWANEAYMSNGDIIFQGNINRLWCGEGIGAWYIDNPPTTFAYGSAVTWTEASVGIENMVNTHMHVDNEGRFLYACHDRRGYVIPRDQIGKRYPNIHVLGPGGAIAHGGNIAVAPDDPNIMTCTVFLSSGAKSVNGGASWDAMPGDPRTVSGGAGGGSIAMLSSMVYIQRETNNGQILWTKDGGVTWVKLLPGGADYPYYGSHPGYWANHRPLIADKYVANQAYLYLAGNGTGDAEDLSYRGIWRFNYNPTTEVMTTTRVKGPTNPYITSYGQDYWHVEFAQIGVDDWLFCGADNCVGLWRSTDGMATWNQLGGTDDVNAGVRGFSEVYGVAVGAGRTVGTKTIFASGFRTDPQTSSPANYDDFGYWLSEDLGATWTRIEQLLDGCPQGGGVVAADPEVYGLFYAGPASEGVFRIRYQDKRAWS